MLSILSRQNEPLLARFAQSKALIAFDYDGTLAPVINNSEAHAQLRPETRELLSHLTLRYPTMLISGRADDDARKRVEGSGIQYIIGNHGAGLGDVPKITALIAQWPPILDTALAGLPGVWTESKGLSLTVHFRHAPDVSKARKLVMKAAALLKGARLLPAKQGLNIVAENAPHKGDALEFERAALGCDEVLFAGDDGTDEDGFGMKLHGELIGVRVGQSRTSKAGYYLRNQAEMDTLLRRLIELRPNY